MITFNSIAQYSIPILILTMLLLQIGDSVTLHTGVTDSQKHDLILWTFGPKNPDSLIAELNMKVHEITFSSEDIYRGRLHLENQTGSLTIRDVRTTDAGVYQLQISNSKETLYKRFNIFVGTTRLCQIALKDSLLIHQKIDF
uniref:Immunoglobulin V-set domain-containing protein n=1 Tax=Sinocyclocheilus anshuiensis TaxID=1608454 RepID=A0A671QQP5_9TELE